MTLTGELETCVRFGEIFSHSTKAGELLIDSWVSAGKPPLPVMMKELPPAILSFLMFLGQYQSSPKKSLQESQLQ